MFRHSKPFCFSYPTNHTQHLQARDEINPGTMIDPVPPLPFSDWETVHGATKQCHQETEAASVISPCLLPLLVGGPSCCLWKATGCQGLPLTYNLPKHHQNKAQDVLLPPLPDLSPRSALKSPELIRPNL